MRYDNTRSNLLLVMLDPDSSVASLSEANRLVKNFVAEKSWSKGFDELVEKVGAPPPIWSRDPSLLLVRIRENAPTPEVFTTTANSSDRAPKVSVERMRVARVVILSHSYGVVWYWRPLGCLVRLHQLQLIVVGFFAATCRKIKWRSRFSGSAIGYNFLSSIRLLVSAHNYSS